MIDKSVIERYVEESSLKMKVKSKKSAEYLLNLFFRQKEFSQFSDLTRDDFIEMYSSLRMIEYNSFETHKSKLKDFVIWMFENGYGTQEQIDMISSLNYSDINIDYLYDMCYFSDCTDLFTTLDMVFEECKEEFDTFKVSAILVWMGLELEDIVNLQKSALIETEGIIIHPRTQDHLIVPAPKFIMDFLVKYRDADSYESNKMGGRIVPYMETVYLIRSYKNAYYTRQKLLHSPAATKKYAEQYGKLFQWKSIQLSGLYYRINEFEKENGSIQSDLDMLCSFFCPGNKPKLSKVALVKKYRKYEDFKEHMLV